MAGKNEAKREAICDAGDVKVKTCAYLFSLSVEIDKRIVESEELNAEVRGFIESGVYDKRKVRSLIKKAEVSIAAARAYAKARDMFIDCFDMKEGA